MSEWTREELVPVLAYIGQVRDALRMQNWDVILHFEKNEEENVLGHTWQEHNHTTGNIDLGVDFFDQTPERIRNIIVHELIHFQHRDLGRLWEECTKYNDAIAPADFKAWDGDFHVYIERFVSWITQRIGPTVPDYTGKLKEKDIPDGCYFVGEHQA